VTITHRIADRDGALTNVALGAVLTAVLAADVAVTAAHYDSWVFELAVGVIVCAVALLRARNRVRATAAGLAVCLVADVVADVSHLPSQPGVAASLGLLVLGAAAVRVAAPRSAAVLALAGVIVVVAGRFALRGEYVAPFAFLGVLMWGGALAVGVWLRFLDTRRRLAIDTARRDERLDLARELHDVVAHHVAGIVVQAQAARLVAAKRPETLEDTLAGIESAGNDALAAMRRVVGLLRDPDDTQGRAAGPEQLTNLIDRFANHGPEVHLRLPENAETDQPPWPPEVAATVYRIVQEALTNIVLHAPAAANVTVAVDTSPTGITVEITDDGHAGSLASPPFALSGGNGLVGMRERVQALGGELHVGPGPSGGWVVQATLPLPAGSAI
jgi:signal transduction histidine kinase